MKTIITLGAALWFAAVLLVIQEDDRVKRVAALQLQAVKSQCAARDAAGNFYWLPKVAP